LAAALPSLLSSPPAAAAATTTTTTTTTSRPVGEVYVHGSKVEVKYNSGWRVGMVLVSRIPSNFWTASNHFDLLLD